MQKGSTLSLLTPGVNNNRKDPAYFPDHFLNYFFLLFGFLTSFF
ncbi:MAG: hypothetical protein H6R44_534 [Nitrospirae bacterium]|nr:hypothetical protein [Nitrospirota bacterium]